MVDMNLWRLEYDSVSFEFGTRDTGRPLTKQVSVEPGDLDVEDLAHPSGGGLLPGVDYERGQTLTFAGAFLPPGATAYDRRHVSPMDDSALFNSAWRARSVRRVSGKVATLTNVDRGRMVYGRPRLPKQSHEKARHGWLTYDARFDTVDEVFYSTDVTTLRTGVSPGPAAAFVFPLEFPYEGTGGTTSRTWASNRGTTDSWPVITFRRGSNPTVELLDSEGGAPQWTLRVAASLAYDEVVTVDCRPWVRKVIRNGSPAPGIIRGDSLTDMIIPVGDHELRYSAVDQSGQADVAVEWRDAYDAL